MNFGPLVLASQIASVLLLSTIAYLVAPPNAQWLFGLVTGVLGHAVILLVWLKESVRRLCRRTLTLCLVSLLAIAALTGYYVLRAECVVWPTTPQTFEPKFVYFPIQLTGQIAELVQKYGSRQAVVDRFQPLSVKRILEQSSGFEWERSVTTVVLLVLIAAAAVFLTVLLHVLTSALLERADILYGAGTATRRYKVALSFAGGKNRQFVENVAEYLAREIGRRDVFYDNWLTSILARTNLHTWLQRIYASQSELVVPFLDVEYERRDWCRIEWAAIRKLVDAGRHDQVMPIRLDESPITGLLPTDGYIDRGKQTAQEISQLILDRYRTLQTVANPDGNG
jgi:hypothetical protein